MQKTLGFIGCGNMASAIVAGVSGKFLPAGHIFACAKHFDALCERAPKLGLTPRKTAAEVAQESSVVVLAVKPNVVRSVIEEAGAALEGKAVLSIAAGVASESLKAWLPDSARVLRAMPNTPAMVGAGATALCEDTATFTEEEKAWVKELFDRVGKAIWVPERLMDAVVGVSGSGPAYVFLFIEAMADGGVRMGLPRATAMELAVQTVLGSAKLCAESGMHPGALKDMVCSPGGTTIEAVAELEKRGLRASVIEAVRACAEKSANLS